MSKIKILIALSLVMIGLLSFTNQTTSNNYKCMLQMNAYDGEGAYIILSLINPDDEYEKTLYVMGKDEDWYSDISGWWNYYGKKRYELDGITGATLSGGKTGISIIEIEDSKIDSGYKIRFETAVEDMEYYKKDIEFELTTESLKSKTNGGGYINYVRMIPAL